MQIMHPNFEYLSTVNSILIIYFIMFMLMQYVLCFLILIMYFMYAEEINK